MWNRKVDRPKTRPRVLAITNQKGGVGKTTTAINLATALVAVGEKVLIIDLDPQGNASTGLGVPNTIEARTPSALEVLTGEASVRQAMLPTDIDDMSIVPAQIDLTAMEAEGGGRTGRNFRLRDALNAHFADPQNDDVCPSYVLIDCPPSLNILTVNALAAADAVIVPLQCEFFALEGLGLLVKTIDQVREQLNPELTIQGVILTMHDRRNSLSHQVEDDVREFLGQKVYSTIIPRNVRLSEAPSFGKPALLYDHSCPGSKAYIKFASELIKRERGLAAA
ncbi:MAG: ParA family protein [Hyphomicrobiales bacterium]|nr:ParA family protein [Hyphomicrobiales bacterium]